MRIVATFIALLSSAVLVSVTLAANTPDRPPGVDADHWVSLGASIGVVLTNGVAAVGNGNGNSRKLPLVIPDRTALIVPTRPFVLRAVERAEAREPIQGYIMIKQAGTWRRLDVGSP